MQTNESNQTGSVKSNMKSTKAKKASARSPKKTAAKPKATEATHRTDDLNLAKSEMQFMNEAAKFLQDPGLTAKALGWAGKPMESLHHTLPDRAKKVIASATQKAVTKAMVAAIATLSSKAHEGPSIQASARSSFLHRGLATLSGAASGMFGLLALPIELPISTILILRGITDQARIFGHDPNEAETRLECLMILSLGPNPQEATPENSAYFMARASFSGIVRNAARFTASMTATEIAMAIEKGSAPILVKLMSMIAKPFEARVTQKFLAGSVPVTGAIGGGLLNYAFTDYFVKAAKYHFGVRALEKKYGTELVQTMLKQKMAAL